MSFLFDRELLKSILEPRLECTIHFTACGFLNLHTSSTSADDSVEMASDRNAHHRPNGIKLM